MIRTGLFALMLVVSGACAQTSPPADSTPPGAGRSSTHETRDEELRPYLGKWRPTSFGEQQNIGSLSISGNTLTLETGPSLTFEIARVEEPAVILRVTGHSPPDSFVTVGALALRLESVALRNPTPERKTRQLLRIHWCNSLDDLAKGIGKAKCSINGYMR